MNEGLHKIIEKDENSKEEENMRKVRQTMKEITKIASLESHAYSGLLEIISVMSSMNTGRLSMISRFNIERDEKGGSYNQDNYYLKGGALQYNLGSYGLNMISKLIEENILLPEKWIDGYFIKGEENEELEDVSAKKEEVTFQEFCDLSKKEKTTLEYLFNDAFSEYNNVGLDEEIKMRDKVKDSEIESFREGYKKTKLSFGGYNSASSHMEKAIYKESVLKSMENIDDNIENEGIFVATVENFI